jgi:N,N'-diacetyllegionaminate synthase
MSKQPVKIIAEIGVNHNGQMELAYQLIDVAKDAGADIVKFQTSIPSLLISKHAIKAEYQFSSTDPNETQLEMCNKLAFPLENFDDLKLYAETKGIKFLSTPFDLVSIDYLNQLGLSIFKIPSGEITNLPYLRKIGGFNKNVIMSSGMAELSEIQEAINVLTQSGTKKNKITVLHCNTAYPTPFKDVNLKAMITIREELGVEVGYSDHTMGIEIPIAAVALGATVIEKHFTLDRNFHGPDHQASLEPDELKLMVLAIRNLEKALGNGVKQPSPSEMKNILIARKSIIASHPIRKGEIFSEGNLTVKRPGSGISPMQWDEVIGKYAAQDFAIDELIEL